MIQRTPTYATPEDVAETLDLQDPNDPYATPTFNNKTRPTYDRVVKYILGAEDVIDHDLNRSWRENIVEDFVTDIHTYQWDENAWRTAYWINGGNYISLKREVRPWNPFPVNEYARNSSGEILEEQADCYVRERLGDPILDDKGDKIYEYVHALNAEGAEIADEDGRSVYVNIAKTDGGIGDDLVHPMSPVVAKVLYEGDRLLIRGRMNQWFDISDIVTSDGGPNENAWESAWIDRAHGKLYIRNRLMQAKANSVRIRYRYGQDPDKMPMAINRMCCILVAEQIITGDIYNVKVGAGGEMAGVKEQLLRRWDAEIANTISIYRRSSPVRSSQR